MLVFAMPPTPLEISFYRMSPTRPTFWFRPWSYPNNENHKDPPELSYLTKLFIHIMVQNRSCGCHHGWPQKPLWSCIKLQSAVHRGANFFWTPKKSKKIPNKPRILENDRNQCLFSLVHTIKQNKGPPKS